MSPLEPPSAPFAQRTSSPAFSSGSSREDSPGLADSRSRLNVSLSTHFLPSKFSSTMLDAGPRRRRMKGKDIEMDPLRIPKMGGGVEAFRAGEPRMGGGRDDDDDYHNYGHEDSRATTTSRTGLWTFWKKDGGIGGNSRTGSSSAKKMRWNRFKWTLFFSNVIFTVYSFLFLIVCLLTWFNAWTGADVVRVGNRTELIISTLACCMGLFTSLVGWAGILMNNRMFLAIYSFLCWITFIFLVVPGYLTYKKRTFNLEGKVNAQWSRDLGAEGRMIVQGQLECCGYFSPYVEATVSQTCYSRSVLPGCKKGYIDFERKLLKKWYTVVFSLVPVQLMVMVVGLICSNHVTYRFGKGMMPKAYRLSLNSMAVIMEQYAQQLVEHYGVDLATDIMEQDKAPRMPKDQEKIPSLSYLNHLNGNSLSSSGGTSLMGLGGKG
ncbi:hypothetical protein FA15DRAFT_644160 [Coprinopsis marcescibilis]|uniref:Tetraspanin Tsp2 n=1 Tax=Coprinopsis marcescibilis TaxID=230819 RepID=A0A5C3KPY8_COPMA|nr:hypothetical protein FA15DRAFT_644160 [Coprinopsis marcescibilis]